MRITKKITHISFSPSLKKLNVTNLTIWHNFLRVGWSYTSMLLSEHLLRYIPHYFITPRRGLYNLDVDDYTSRKYIVLEFEDHKTSWGNIYIDNICCVPEYPEYPLFMILIVLQKKFKEIKSRYAMWLNTFLFRWKFIIL